MYRVAETTAQARFTLHIGIVLMVLIHASIASAEPFSYLKQIEVANYKSIGVNKRSYIHVDPAKYQEINKKRSEYSVGHPFHIGKKRFGGEDMVLGLSDLTGKNDKYYVIISEGPSFDVAYYFCKESRVKEAVDDGDSDIKCDTGVDGLSVVLPGNGFAYSYGHNNTLADTRIKYELKNGKFEEVSQPFYYVGKEAKSLKDQIVYTDETLAKEAFRITKNYKVTVVGIKYRNQNAPGTGDLYLIASEFGLLGWVPAEMTQQETQFEGFYFLGD